MRIYNSWKDIGGKLEWNWQHLWKTSKKGKKVPNMTALAKRGMPKVGGEREWYDLERRLKPELPWRCRENHVIGQRNCKCLMSPSLKVNFTRRPCRHDHGIMVRRYRTFIQPLLQCVSDTNLAISNKTENQLQ